jgi:hypothetical protein
MTQCLAGCKWTCIISYILASLGALVLAMNTFKKDSYKAPKFLVILYAIGAVITLICSAKWAFSKKD